MTYMNPWLLMGALGIALPIIAHILNNHKYQQTDWAAMQFLNAAIKVKSREIRIRDLFLLLVRVLMFLLLALIIAGPMVNEEDSFFAKFGEKRAGVIIALDTSFSMLHQDGSESRFDKAIDKVERIVENLTLGDPITLVALGTVHRTILRNRAYQPDEFRSVLNNLEARPEALDVDSIPRQIKDLVDEMSSPQKEIYIITDAQEQDWRDGVVRLHYALKDLSTRANLFMVPVTGGQENLAITKFELLSGVLRKNTSARYSVTVHNYGQSPATSVKVSGKVNGITVDSKTILKIEAGSAKTISLFIPFQNAGPSKISAHIPQDELETDNIRRSVAIIRNKVSVLCIENPSEGEGSKGFIASALMAREGGVEEEDFSVKTISWVSLPSEDLNNYDVVVMSDVPTITEEQAKKLDTFVRRGNGLIWLPGENTKWKSWNERSKQEGSPFLPAVLEGTIKTSDAMGIGNPLSPNIPEHSITKPLLSLSEDLLSEARFLQVFQVEPSPNSLTVLKLSGGTVPLLLEHSHGRGQVFLFTSSAGSEWNNMALTPIFPMLVQQMVTYLTAREFEKPRLVGGAISLSYEEEPDVTDAIFETPSGETLSVPVHQHRNRFVAVLGEAEEAGFYLARGTLQSPNLPIAVNINTHESNVKSLPIDDYDNVFGSTGMNILSSDDELGDAISESRKMTSLWKFFGLFCLAFLFVESLLACRLPKKKTSVSES